MNTKRTARAVVYAARMAHLIDSYGHTWANIEATTKAILEGHPVPPDNMVVVDTMGVTYTGPLVERVSPGDETERVALELVDKYHAVRNEMRTLERELSNTKEALRVESVAAQNARIELGEANARNTRQAETIRGLRGERDGYKWGAQFWMDEANERADVRDKAESKVVKLRTFLQGVVAYPMNGDTLSTSSRIKEVLEETK